VSSKDASFLQNVPTSVAASVPFPGGGTDGGGGGGGGGGDCPVASVLPSLNLGGNPTWMALDTVTQKLCVLDDNTSSIYFVNALTNTLLASVDLGGGSGAPSIIMDTLNAQFVIMNYDGDIIFVDPVAQSEITRIAGIIRHPSSNLLAYDPVSGNTFACSYRDVTGLTGFMRVISGSSHTVLSSTHTTTAPDAITWCPNISRVYITRVGLGLPLYVLFDPVGLTFTNSAQVTDTNFNYECFFNSHTQTVLQSRDGSHPSRSVNVVSDTTVGSLAPVRLASMVVNTCTNETWVSDGNLTVYELNPDLTTKATTSAHPNGLGFSRKTNLVYYTDYNTLTNSTLATT